MKHDHRPAHGPLAAAIASPDRRRVMRNAFTGCLALAVLPGCGASSGSAEGSLEATIADGRTAIRQAMARSSTSSVSVALLDGTQVVWQEAFGVIDRESHTPAGPDTRYNIGSVSKVFAAVATMVLVDRGLVDLDAPVATYIRDFRMLSPDAARITVRMLLNHSSGFPGSNYRNIFTLAPLQGYARDTQAVLARSRLKHEPGEFSVYCNDGFTIAERVVEEVSGKSYARFVQDEILTPLGMARSGYPLQYFPEGSFAHSYLGERRFPQEFVHAHGSGGLCSTPGDMLRFARMFIEGGALEGRRILSSAAVAEMGRSQTDGAPLQPVKGWQWGLGWDLAAHPAFAAIGLRCWQKNGGTALYGSDFFVLPDQGLAVMVTGTSTRYGSGKLAERILLHALQEKHLIPSLPAPLPTAAPPAVQAEPAVLDGLAGYYGNSDGAWQVVHAGDGTLSLRTWEPATGWKVHAEGLRLRGDGWYSADDAQVSYGFTEAGPYRYLTTRMVGGQGHYHVTLPHAQRLPDVAALPPAWQARVGQRWLLVNEHESSMVLAIDSPLVTLHAIPELPGFVRLDGPLLLPEDDLRTRQFLRIPGNYGRDLNELAVERQEDGEWLAYGGQRLRPLATVPAVAPGQHGVAFDGRGDAQWRRLAAGTSSVRIVGARAWRLYDAAWALLASGQGAGQARFPATGQCHLMLFADPNSQVRLTVA